MNRSESDWIAASQRPQRYLNKDPHKHIPFADEAEGWADLPALESFLWGLVLGICLTVIAVV